MKSIIIIIFILFSSNLMANTQHDIYEADGSKYTLVKKDADTYLSGYLLFSKKLFNCKKHVFKYFNPLIRKDGLYEIMGKNREGQCILYVNYNELKEFKCNLNEDNVLSIVEGRMELISKKGGFGQLSDSEKDVYYNKSVCKENRVESKVEEIDLKELKKSINNPELIDFLETFNSNKVKK